MEWFSEEMQKILLAVVLGAVIGLEREWSGKSAGFRTIILVTTGSALFTIASYQVAGVDVFEETDVSRIASNIVTGIGFIGAGIIFRGSKGVQGLTTAATVWMGAAIGLAVGVGSYGLAIFTTIVVWLILVLLFRAEILLGKMAETLTYNIRFEADEDFLHPQDFFEHKSYKMIDTKYARSGENNTVIWTIRARHSKHEKAIKKMLADKRIAHMDYS